MVRHYPALNGKSLSDQALDPRGLDEVLRAAVMSYTPDKVFRSTADALGNLKALHSTSAADDSSVNAMPTFAVEVRNKGRDTVVTNGLSAMHDEQASHPRMAGQARGRKREITGKQWWEQSRKIKARSLERAASKIASGGKATKKTEPPHLSQETAHSAMQPELGESRAISPSRSPELIS